jgi:hypothetical protein
MKRANETGIVTLNRGDNFSPRLPSQWYVRGGGEGTEIKKDADSDWSVRPPTSIGMTFDMS